MRIALGPSRRTGLAWRQIVVTGRVQIPAERRERFIEEWADEQALQRHFAQQHTGSFLQALGGLLGEPADALFHRTAATRRLDPGRGLVPVE